MKSLKIEGSFEGYVSVFGLIDQDLRKDLLEIDDAFDRIDAVEDAVDYTIFSNGIDVESVSLSITLDGEDLYEGHIKNLPVENKIVDRKDLPKFEDIFTGRNEKGVYIRHREWFEEGSFEHDIEVSDDFKLTDLKVFLIDLAQGDALASGLFKQVKLEMRTVLEFFEVEGTRHFVETDCGNETNFSESFMIITELGEIFPDFELE
jgi:hypothetical protein